MSDNYVQTDILDYIDILKYKYTPSRTFITYIENFGSLCVSISVQKDYLYAFCRSILGLKEFKYFNDDSSEKSILLRAVYEYFQLFVKNWDIQINTKPRFFDTLLSFVSFNLYSIGTSITSNSLSSLVQVNILSNIHNFKIEVLRNRFIELNYFYAEEIENFILRDFLDIEIKSTKKEVINHFNEIIVTSEDLGKTQIEYEDLENGPEIIIKEFIYSEIEVLQIVNKTYYDEILKFKDRLPAFKYNEYFKDIEDFFNLSKLLVKSLVRAFYQYKYPSVSHTLADIFITEKSTSDKSHKIKFVNEEKDIVEKFTRILVDNGDYFDFYRNIVSGHKNILKNCNIKGANLINLSDTYNIILQRLTKFDLLFSRILKYTDPKSHGYDLLKTFKLKLKKFVVFLDDLLDEQCKKERTWDLCIKHQLIDVKGNFIDEITSNGLMFILLANYILIVENDKLIDFLNVKNLDVHENGKKSFFIITNKKINIDLHYHFELENYKMYVIKCICLSKGIRDRFVLNVRQSRKKYSTNQQVIVKTIVKNLETYSIPFLYKKDEEWILMKYKFIMEEVLNANENNEIVNMNELD